MFCNVMKYPYSFLLCPAQGEVSLPGLLDSWLQDGCCATRPHNHIPGLKKSKRWRVKRFFILRVCLLFQEGMPFPGKSSIYLLCLHRKAKQGKSREWMLIQPLSSGQGASMIWRASVEVSFYGGGIISPPQGSRKTRAAGCGHMRNHFTSSQALGRERETLLFSFITLIKWLLCSCNYTVE